jgi:hypothetical protein
MAAPKQKQLASTLSRIAEALLSETDEDIAAASVAPSVSWSWWLLTRLLWAAAWLALVVVLRKFGILRLLSDAVMSVVSSSRGTATGAAADGSTGGSSVASVAAAASATLEQTIEQLRVQVSEAAEKQKACAAREIAMRQSLLAQLDTARVANEKAAAADKLMLEVESLKQERVSLSDKCEALVSYAAGLEQLVVSQQHALSAMEAARSTKPNTLAIIAAQQHEEERVEWERVVDDQRAYIALLQAQLTRSSVAASSSPGRFPSPTKTATQSPS